MGKIFDIVRARRVSKFRVESCVRQMVERMTNVGWKDRPCSFAMTVSSQEEINNAKTEGQWRFSGRKMATEMGVWCHWDVMLRVVVNRRDDMDWIYIG